MKPMLRNFRFLFALLIPVLWLPLQVHAENASRNQSTKEMEQQLTNVEEQVKQQKQELEQERKKAAQLEKQVDCNYKLLKGYKACEDKFSKTSQEYLDCSIKAKKSYDECVSAIATD